MSLKKPWQLKLPDPISQPSRFSSMPLQASQKILEIRAKMQTPADPWTVRTKGLQSGDKLVFDWIDPTEHRLTGCRISSYGMREGEEERKLLKWVTGGVGRDPLGRCIYGCYLRNLEAVQSFAQMVAVFCGFSLLEDLRTDTRLTYLLQDDGSENRRIIAGDHLCFDLKSQILRGVRSQGTIDMNLYRPSISEEGIIWECAVPYISELHHVEASAHVLVEVNGLRMQVHSPGTFLVVPR
jgi:hypothetical protein